MTLPNIITIARLLLVPVVIAMIGAERWQWAFALFVVAGVSDAVDGFIARRFDMKSELGAYIDALADKALLVSIYVALAIGGVLPGWLAILVVSRDVMILMAVIVSWLMSRPVEIRPLIVSKLNTGMQIALAAIVLGSLGFGLDWGPLIDIVMIIVACLTLASAGAYLAVWSRHMAK
ncbi:MAG: CDP-alcohol phosphatidyltransferase family protein [Chelatococcus sp.]|jgi:cardiolipin synthase|uniref:CDP-alcohol phosphatidyltransferase family protein n=1 Tax=unclassified Chelatococcus TaxID=2638111 RepID=UPI001BCEB893|nr:MULTISPECIES: CDP-alcohol phosphatidyltransferase family protein [unclassified Chelatococcus]CAH1669834.1 CDP-diacylglycerol--glycerol-3-phosphate 3-phosphatidyltransferase [Hyphomicrobiales bacterium]MBS7738259.1 CDP-alcohol phosphatidyltransferase family protein [Chelatococcus sp. HY11]MBX3537809.1 CDP-alcohol phosphatidyltransferase family protein [Chelatococcus sp.]MBX3545787.1 CDP-alcohol phosphatidyltransferase family protein [Chelatococcus sp.]MCO5077395.1 CDP-alcohol phosphatidyltra